MKDKREECGCHRQCVTLPHDCNKPCNWPACLSEEEQIKLLESITASELF